MQKLNITRVRSLAGRGYRLAMLPRDWLIRGALARVGAPLGPRLARVLDQLERSDARDQDATIDAIERERASLARREDPLDDGSLGPPGLYDTGLSVRDACRASKPPRPSLLMHLLVRELAPRQILELGTNLGISSAYEASALRANGVGQLTTMEASPYRIRVARQLHERLGLNNVTYVQGLFEATLKPTLQDLPPVDFAFIDGHHQYQPTLDYTNLILEHAARDAILVFDDIRWSDGMKRAWRMLKVDRRFHFVLDLYGIGICARVGAPTSRRVALPPIFHAVS